MEKVVWIDLGNIDLNRIHFIYNNTLTTEQLVPATSNIVRNIHEVS